MPLTLRLWRILILRTAGAEDARRDYDGNGDLPARVNPRSRVKVSTRNTVRKRITTRRGARGGPNEARRQTTRGQYLPGKLVSTKWHPSTGVQRAEQDWGSGSDARLFVKIRNTTFRPQNGPIRGVLNNQTAMGCSRRPRLNACALLWRKVSPVLTLAHPSAVLTA